MKKLNISLTEFNISDNVVLPENSLLFNSKLEAMRSENKTQRLFYIELCEYNNVKTKVLHEILID